MPANFQSGKAKVNWRVPAASVSVGARASEVSQTLDVVVFNHRSRAIYILCLKKSAKCSRVGNFDNKS